MYFMPEHARPAGTYELDIVFETIYNHWREGKQIVLLLGAGISVQSGYPTLPMLAEHLLTLNAIKSRTLQARPQDTKAGRNGAPAYDLERDGWMPLTRLLEFCPEQQADMMGGSRKLILELIERQLKNSDIKPLDSHFLDRATDNQLFEFADYSLGLSWLQLMEMIANNRSQLVDSVFLSLGAMPSPGPAHNFLAHCISLFNVRLVLTTNFDTLIEQTLQKEGYEPLRFDIHTSSPPPSHNQVKRQMSVVKLHGSTYGLRADRSINAPLEEGHMQTLLEYFEEDTLLLCLDYGGNDGRVMGLIRELAERPERRKQEGKNFRTTIIRVDGMASGAHNSFRQLSMDCEATIHNLFYPPPGLFLLHLYQYASGNLPLSRRVYPTVIHSPAPHAQAPTLGMSSNAETASQEINEKIKDRKPLEDKVTRAHEELARKVWERMEGISGNGSTQSPIRAALIEGPPGSGVSHTLSQICEHFYTGYQLFWCDIDEVTTFGTVAASLYDFVLGRQPNLPRSPLPMTLPHLNDENVAFGAKEHESVQRVVDALWERLKRGRYVLVFDSLASAVSMMLEQPGHWNTEAIRLITFLSLLFQRISQSPRAGKCILMVGTHNLPDPHRSAIENALNLQGGSVVDLPEEKLRVLKSFLSLLVSPGKIKPPLVEWRPNIWKQAKEQDDSGARDKIATFRVRGTTSIGCLASLVPPKVSYQYILPGNYPLDSSAIKSDDDHYLVSVVKGMQDRKLSDVDKIYLYFLFDCSWANRPRSWSQILSLPTVEQLDDFELFHKSVVDPDCDWKSKPQYPKEWDKRSKFAYLLLEKATKDGLLRLQPGGFYYMDTGPRNLLRELSKKEDHAGTFTPDTAYLKQDSDYKPWKLRRVHRRQMRYYERSLNQSGDMTALQYFYWHGKRLHDMVESAEQSNIKAEIARGVLENTQPARGHLCAYDHCFLLLQLRQLLLGHEEKPLKSMRKSAEQALNDLYEDYEDYEGGEQIREARSNGTDELEQFKILHMKQKIKAQSFDYEDALKSGLSALLVCEGEQEPAPTTPLETLGKQRLQRDNTLINTTEWHRIHLRLIRVMLRVAVMGEEETFPSKVFSKENIKLLLNDGRKRLSALPVDEGIKLLWARYYTLRAMLLIIYLNKDNKTETISKTLAYLNWAKSYAKAVRGGLGQTYTAVADIITAESLIWEGRYLMQDSTSDSWRQAAARQESAVRHLEALQVDLTVGRTSLVWWRELAIHLAMATADILKRWIFELRSDAPEGLPAPEKCREFFENFSRTLERGILDVQLLSSVIWQDRWRESRLFFQTLRIAWYSCYVLSFYLKIIQSTEKDYEKQLSAIAPSFNRILRAFRALSPKIPLLPLIDEKEPQEYWANFETKLGEAIYEQIHVLFSTLDKCLTDLEGDKKSGISISTEQIKAESAILKGWFFGDSPVRDGEEFFEHLKGVYDNDNGQYRVPFPPNYGSGGI